MNANGILDFIHSNIYGPFKIKFGVNKLLLHNLQLSLLKENLGVFFEVQKSGSKYLQNFQKGYRERNWKRYQNYNI
jgi:hypothetical protein